MSRRCNICERGSTKDASRSHANNKTLKRQHVNLQTKKVSGGKIKVCTRCLKTVNQMS